MEPQYQSESVQRIYELLKKYNLLSDSIRHTLKDMNRVDMERKEFSKDIDKFIIKYCSDVIR